MYFFGSIRIAHNYSYVICVFWWLTILIDIESELYESHHDIYTFTSCFLYRYLLLFYRYFSFYYYYFIIIFRYFILIFRYFSFICFYLLFSYMSIHLRYNGWFAFRIDELVIDT